jgi:hypothetical protein
VITEVTENPSAFSPTLARARFLIKERSFCTGEIEDAGSVTSVTRQINRRPTLEAAVDQKVEQIVEFVRWWTETVGANHGAGRWNKNAGLGSLSAEEAERLTGISNQQVSRWRKRIKDEA